MTAQELGRHDALSQGMLVRAREMTAQELLEAALARMDAVDPQLNAVVIRYDELARCRTSDAECASGPLAGVPYLLKDLHADDAGTRRTDGSRAVAGEVARCDSELVRRLKAAGLVLCGRTATPEFGNASTTESALYGVTRNPWDRERTPGGSSGGAAAAVAAGIVPAAHGSDGGGSIRTPAACCGVFGLKPSRGVVSNAPEPDLLAGWSVQHALTRTVRDSAALLDAVAGALPGDPHRTGPPQRKFLAALDDRPGRLRIGVGLRPPSGSALDDRCERVAVAASRLLEEMGHELVPLDLELSWERFAEVYLTIVGVAFAAALDALERRLPGAIGWFEPLTVAFADAGRHLHATDYLARVAEMQAINHEVAGALAHVDAWLTPALTRPALPLGELSLEACGSFAAYKQLEWAWNPWLPLANCVGLPSAAIPFADDDDLPIGVALTGRAGDEATLLRLSAQLEQARPWHDRWPAINAVGMTTVRSRQPC